MRFCPHKLVLAAPLLFTACATIRPPQPPSLELPKPPADLQATRKGNKVMLTWTVPTITTDRQTVRSLGPTRICRGTGPVLTECGTPVGGATPVVNAANGSGRKITASCTEPLPTQAESANPAGTVTYAVEVLNGKGRGAGLSNQVRVWLASTLPPPQNFRADVTSLGVVLSWAGEAPPVPPQPGMRYVYRVYRRVEGSQQKILAGEAPVGNEPQGTLTDSSIEWEKTYEYRAEIVTVIAREGQPEAQIEGDDTPEIKVFAHDIFPPAVPGGLQAVFSGPGQAPFIDLIWAPVTDADLGGYNVYRREEGATPVKVNPQPVKAPAYRDMSVVSGRTYSYSVSAVDVRGNESARSEEAAETVP